VRYACSFAIVSMFVVVPASMALPFRPSSGATPQPSCTLNRCKITSVSADNLCERCDYMRQTLFFTCAIVVRAREGFVGVTHVCSALRLLKLAFALDTWLIKPLDHFIPHPRPTKCRLRPTSFPDLVTTPLTTTCKSPSRGR
jgi:hypothetical protein